MSATTPSRSRFRWFLYAVVVLGLGAGVWYFGFRDQPQGFRYPQPAWAGNEYPWRVPVRTVPAERRDLPVHLKAIGTVTPLNMVTVKSRVDGQLLRVHFEEGQQVERGQLLAEIDPAPYRIKLAQAEGELRQSAAQVRTARSDLTRIQELSTKGLVTQQQLELQQALVAEREGALAAMQALVDDARLQLAYTRVEAPISGRVGFRRVDPGNLIRSSDESGLVVITQTAPIFVSFTIPEVELASVVEPFRAGRELLVEAWDRNERSVLARGTLKTLDNQIDPATGTLRLKAEFANADERLFPSQFVNVRMHVRTLQQAIVIPSAAVQFGSRGTYIYVIDAENKAVIRNVVLGPTEGSDQAIVEGVAVGEAIVLEGLDRLREGSNVVIANEAAAETSSGSAKATP